MPEPDSPNTANSAQRKAELEALFQQWDERGGAEDQEHEPGLREGRLKLLDYGVKLRFVVSAILIGITALVMINSWDRLAYFLQSDTPVELGDLRTQWRNGDRDFKGRSNSHAAMKGLVITRELIAIGDEGSLEDIPEDATRLFFCPLFNIVVRTNRPLPEKPRHRTASIEIDADFVELLQNRMALPYDLVVSFEGSGRLVSGDDVPSEMNRALNSYAKRLNLNKDEMWVFIDGDLPSSHWLMAIIWVLAAIVPLVSLFFLLRAIRHRSRERSRT